MMDTRDSKPRVRSTQAGIRAVLTSVLVVLSIIAFGLAAGTAAAQDDWPSDCNPAEEDRFQNATGNYNGVLDVPADQDAIQLSLQRGEFVTVAPLVPEAHSKFRLQIYRIQGEDMPDGSIVARNEDLEEGVTRIGGTDADSFRDYDEIIYDVQDRTNGSESTWEMWANVDSFVCIVVSEQAPGDAEFPYEWGLTLQKSDPSVNQTGHRVLSPQEVQQQRQTIDRLQNRVSTLERRVTELERRVKILESRHNRSDQNGTQTPTNTTSRIASEGSRSVVIGGSVVGLAALVTLRRQAS